MKITKADLDRLRTIINDTIVATNIGPRADYMISAVRYRWDIYHSACDRSRVHNVADHLFLRRLYDYLNDNNLDTALKNILS